MTLPGNIYSIKQFLLEQSFPETIEAAVILGSGLGEFSTVIENPVSIAYGDIPDFPQTSVQGHSGELISGTVAGKSVIAFSGRFHRYEGHPYSKTVLPVHLAQAFDAGKLIISNAAGAINTGFRVGDLMVIDDVFRLFEHVSAAPSETFRYNHGETAARVRRIAASIGLEVQRGTYLFAQGPSYETKSEIRAFRILGGDVVGMSTLPELVEAARLQLPAAAISMVTNMAAGVVAGKLDHKHVKAAAESRKDDFARLVTELIKEL
ncbi:purine-nucleoside phosphorylase [Rhodohalobacter sp. 8-1]|uniref:purine-nucleoside phosphorylase n=1 Tax=Rhodohalobacter sp. 8-1 TaxID=3131972 RepID=UPI0030ED4B1E